MKTKLLKERTDLRETHVTIQCCLSMLGTLKTVADLSRPNFRSFMSSSFEASSVSHTSATQSSSTPLLSLPDEPPRVCDPPPTVPGGWHHRTRHKPCRPCIGREPHQKASCCPSPLGSDWDISHNPFVPSHGLHQFHSLRATECRNPNHRLGVRSGVWRMSEPAEQTASPPKHPPTAAAEVSDCKRSCNP